MEPTLFGFSLTSIPKSMGLIYLLIVIGSIGLAVYFGLQYISKEPSKKNKKVKKPK